MNSERLLVLAKHLRSIQPVKFYYGNWITWGWHLDQMENIENLNDPECGTSACAFGHACSISEFRSLGLFFNGYTGEPSFGDKEGLPAAASFFDISYLEARFLFYWDTELDGFDYESPDVDASAKEVADHIESFVKQRLSEDDI